SGTTEGGSSGSGLFTQSGGQYLLRGALWGGSALCSNRSGTDFFSRFDQAYPQLSAYLGAKSTSTTDYTDLWWNPNESGWGLNLVQHPWRAIFGVWYTYDLDGTRTWFVMPGGSWTSDNAYVGTLSASIVTYRPEPRLFARALASLAAAIVEARRLGAVGEARVIVIDNGSDAARPGISPAIAAWPAQAGTIEVVGGHGNVGYGRAN